MYSYYSVGDNLFIGVAPSGHRSEALERALAFAKSYFRTQFILFEEVASKEIEIDEDYERVAIKAIPKPPLDAGQRDFKVLTITSGDPQEVIWVSEGGDIGLPFFNATDQSMVATLTDDNRCHITYNAIMRIKSFVHHSPNFNYASQIDVQLMTLDEHLVGGRLYMGAFGIASCNSSSPFRLRCDVDPDSFPVIEKVRIDFSNPGVTVRCEQARQ